ncbi:MAG: ATP-binding protein [Granulosicoccus sp.]
MSRKLWLLILSIVLLLSLIVTLTLILRINDARNNLAQSDPGAFNYLLQSHRNINAFHDALRDFRDLDGSAERKLEQRRAYQQRFDVLWSGFTVFELDLKNQLDGQQEVDELLGYSTSYLEGNEHLMVAEHELSSSEASKLIEGARVMSQSLAGLGHQYYINSALRRDLWNERLPRLYQLFWTCVALLMLSGTLMVGMLLLSNKRSAELIAKSRKSQREMKHLIDELRSGKLENKAKDSFIAAASHDLRQPLHALGLFLGATEKHIENEAGREALAEAKHCTVELNRLFNSLLDLSRLDAGVVEANKTEFKLDGLLRMMDQEFSALAKQNGVYFSVCRDSFYIHSDAILLNRILRNLLENAFSHSGATDIQIFRERKGAMVRLTVADNGSGIPVAEQSDIFSEYYQLENPERDRSKGLGLGLSIVKRLCEILDIEISMESKVGVGTMFHLDLPIRDSDKQLSGQPSNVSLDAARLPTGMLVAIVDDDANVRRGMISMLESLNFDAIAAESAIEMIQTLRLRELLPDVLVADYRLLNNQTGDVAIHEIRAAFNVDFPAMIITGDTSPGRVIDAANSGFELMHKPVEPDELMRRISRLVGTVKKEVAEAN